MTQDEYADIDLNALSDDELTEQMHNDLYDGLAPEIVEGTNILLGRGWSATRVLDDALVSLPGRSAGLPKATSRSPADAPARSSREAAVDHPM